jgi:molybdopterin-guanine dinucleotide biosynthesis protein B
MHELRDEEEPRLADLLPRLSEVDLVIVEGFKQEAHVKIEVHRRELGKPFLFPDNRNIVAVASDVPPTDENERLPFASLNDVGAICDLAMQHAMSFEAVLQRLTRRAVISTEAR